MYKKIAAIGLSAALALSPLAALAQTDQNAAPAAGAPAAGTENAAPAKPMAKKHKAPKKTSMKSHKKMAPASAPAGGAAPAEQPKS
jgi:hypothetical protein